MKENRKFASIAFLLFVGMVMVQPIGFALVDVQDAREPDYAQYTEVITSDQGDGNQSDIVRIPNGVTWTQENYYSFCDSKPSIQRLVRAWKTANPEREFVRIEPVCAASYVNQEMSDPESQDFLILHREPGQVLGPHEDG